MTNINNVWIVGEKFDGVPFPHVLAVFESEESAQSYKDVQSEEEGSELRVYPRKLRE